VEVAGVDIDLESGHVERDLARRVRTVDDGQNPGPAGTLADKIDRQRQRRWRGDMTHENRFGPFGD